MRRFIQEGPSQLSQAAEAARTVLQVLPGGKPDRVILAGMGGSALGGGIVESLSMLEGSPTVGTFHVARDYDLRAPVGPDSLVVAISYSGETEETISALRQAMTSGARVVAVASGGALLRVAEESTSPQVVAVRIPPQPEGFQPRFSLYYTSCFLISLLQGFGFMTRALDHAALRQQLEDGMLTLENEGRALGARLEGRIPVVYSSSCFESGLARIWRIKFQENAKLPALCGSLPEANHNDMIGFGPEFADRFSFLLITDPWMHPRIGARFELFAEIMDDLGFDISTLELRGTDPLAAIYESLLLADWATAEVASRREIDPVSIPVIQAFKRRLGTWEGDR